MGLDVGVQPLDVDGQPSRCPGRARASSGGRAPCFLSLARAWRAAGANLLSQRFQGHVERNATATHLPTKRSHRRAAEGNSRSAKGRPTGLALRSPASWTAGRAPHSGAAGWARARAIEGHPSVNVVEDVVHAALSSSAPGATAERSLQRRRSSLKIRLWGTPATRDAASSHPSDTASIASQVSATFRITLSQRSRPSSSAPWR
jgi:hypothetical protein